MRRIVKPPGGECSDIFGVQNGASSPVQEQITPRKAKNNYMQSTIFSPDSVDSSPSNGHSPVTPSKMLDTQDRLFGSSPDDNTPRRMVNRQRSSIFEDEVTDSRPKHSATPGRRNVMNPITGEPVSQNGISNGSTNGTSNGIAHGTNGYMNGHSSPESPMNGNSFRVRNPPGGKSSGIF